MRGTWFGWILAIALFNVLVGCGKGSASEGSPAPATTAGPPTASNPGEELYEKLHSGAYQLDSALDNLQEARTALNGIVSDQGGDTKEALLNVLDMLDSSGETLGEYNVSPALAEVQRDAKAAEARRKKAVDEATDAYREIREARTTLTDMLGSGPPAKEKLALEKADDAVGEGLDAIADGIKLLGGSPPPEEKGEE